MKIFKLVTFLFISLMLFTIASYAQKFTKLPQSTDSTYGYSAYNPLQLGKDDPVEGVRNSKKFLAGLKTTSDQELVLLQRTGVTDPNFKASPGGIAANLGKGGVLDRYEFVTSVTKDTITVYVDIYHKAKVMIPLGLKYVKP